MDFLAFQFQQRHLAYRTIGVYKPCISQFHDLVEGQPVGSLPIILQFMKGIFELQPPKLKTSTALSVGQVLAFLQDMDPFENFSLQDLSLKLAMLLALTSAARVHELIALSLASVIKKQDCWRFTCILPIHVKNSRPNHPGRKISFYAYHEYPRLCVVTCLEEYVKKTEKGRGDDQLLIFYKAPNKAIGSQTLSRWLFTVLTKAGVSMGYTVYGTLYQVGFNIRSSQLGLTNGTDIKDC